MYQGKKFLAVIPARGGSKGIPRKNIKNFAGKPLLIWTLEAADKSQYIDRCVVSTEDAEIKTVVQNWGGEVLDRPTEFAKDDTPGVEPILHAVEKLSGYDYVVVLQATSPLRTVEDIDGCIQLAVARQAACCVSVTEAEVSPYWMYQQAADGTMSPVLPIEPGMWYQRQKLPAIYQLNGAVYVVQCDYVKKYHTVVGEHFLGYPMPKSRSYDIDEPIDFFVCEYLMQEKSHV